MFQQSKIRVEIELSPFKQPSWPFENQFLGLRGALECTMTSLSAPMHYENVDFKVYEVQMNAP